MGGYLSTRWNGIRTRQDTGPLLRIDTAILRRRGALEPGTVSALEWFTVRGEPAGSIRVRATSNALTLVYRIGAHGGGWHDMLERIDLETTPCHYGGHRPWFRCPGCQSRRRVLYSVGGVFRCRRCHDLAYTSTRQDAQARSARRIAALHARLEVPGADLYATPLRPASMRQATYRRIVDDLRREQDRQAAYYRAGLERLTREK